MGGSESGGGRGLGAGLLAGALSLVCATGPASSASREFPVLRPATRAQAVAALSGSGALPTSCLTPVVRSVAREGAPHSPAARRALALLRGEIALPGQVDRAEENGIRFRYTVDAASFDRILPDDADGNGWPDAVDAVRLGIEDARGRIGGLLGFPDPGPVTVSLGRIGFGISGYTVDRAGRDGETAIVLDASPEIDLGVLRLAAAHQYTHATVAGSLATLPAEWGEAVAAWVELGAPESVPERTLARLRLGLAASDRGLLGSDAGSAAAIAAWVAFVEEGLGIGALRAVLGELDRGEAVAPSLDRALRLSTGSGLDAALREFQVWSLLVGDWDDGRHFTLAPALGPARFASTHSALPALTLGVEPGIRGTGSAAYLLDGLDPADGLTVRFEGEFGGTWAADLLLVAADERLHRVAIDLDREGRGERSVPLDGFDRAVLLVRNLAASPEPRSFRWSAFAERDYPFALLDLAAARESATAPIVIAWETANERDLVGFNVLRTRVDTGMTVRVNPVWIPPFGDSGHVTAYRFVDADADPDGEYSYRIEGITATGLGRVSTPIVTDTAGAPR